MIKTIHIETIFYTDNRHADVKANVCGNMVYSGLKTRISSFYLLRVTKIVNGFKVVHQKIKYVNPQSNLLCAYIKEWRKF